MQWSACYGLIRDRTCSNACRLWARAPDFIDPPVFLFLYSQGGSATHAPYVSSGSGGIGTVMRAAPGL
jgi:hypothetical protein